MPKTAFAPSVEEQTGEVLIQIYDGGDARFLLYEDAGDGYGYEKGEYQATALCWLSKEQKLLENGEATSTKSIRVVRPL